MTSSSPLPRLARFVSREKPGGAILIIAALAGLLLANSPAADWLIRVASTRLGPPSLHLDLTVAQWAADGLLAIFFFVVGLELKHELVAGSLRSPKHAAVPVVAAVGGMVVPALLFTLGAVALDDSTLHGWAIPTATDIAFALAVLAVFGSRLPGALRTFLLTLAVVDDLLAIVVIAVFYSHGFHPLALIASLTLVGAFAALARMAHLRWWLLVPVALLAWGFMHASGVHATIAGVALGLVVPATRILGEKTTRTHRMERMVRPISAGVALPVFAFFSAAVPLSGGDIAGQPVLWIVAAALVLGKLLGVLGTTAAVTRLTSLRLADGLGLRDLVPVGLLTGIGFTVSLLIADLSFSDGGHNGAAKLGVLVGTAAAALLAALSLVWDSRQIRGDDMNLDGLPDVDRGPMRPDSDWTSDDAGPLTET